MLIVKSIVALPTKQMFYTYYSVITSRTSDITLYTAHLDREARKTATRQNTTIIFRQKPNRQNTTSTLIPTRERRLGCSLALKKFRKTWNNEKKCFQKSVHKNSALPLRIIRTATMYTDPSNYGMKLALVETPPIYTKLFCASTESVIVIIVKTLDL